jgi:hypothetical protein
MKSVALPVSPEPITLPQLSYTLLLYLHLIDVLLYLVLALM